SSRSNDDLRPTRQTDIRRHAPGEHAVVPIGTLRRAAVVHEIAAEVERILLRHPDAAVRGGVAELVFVAGAVNVKVRLLEEDLHDLHRILVAARRGGLLSL